MDIFKHRKSLKTVKIDRCSYLDDIYSLLADFENSILKCNRFMYILIRCSDVNDNINEMYNQWEFNNSENVSENVSECGNFSCICGHDIKEAYWIVNKHNRNELAIGSECIKKFKGISDEIVEDVDREKRKVQYEKRGGGKKRQCKSCSKFRIAFNKPSYIKQCKTCWKEKMPICNTVLKSYRTCDGCGEKNIDPSEPEWKKKCLDCYRKSKSNAVQRLCSLCGSRSDGTCEYCKDVYGNI